MTSPTLMFVPRKDRAGESICLICYKTIRADLQLGLEDAQRMHHCHPLDVLVARRPETMNHTAL